MPRKKYPEICEIEDPSPRLPAEVARQIAPIIPNTVVRLRKEETDRGGMEVLAKAAVEIFETLVSRRSREVHAEVESLRRALEEDAETALAYAHHIYKTAGFGRMLWLWHREIERRLDLSEKRVAIETEWWERRADENLASPVVPPPIPTRAPRTATAARIEKFMHDTHNKAGIVINKMDIWLVAGYHSDKEFRRFQAEDQLSVGIIQRFNRVLRMEAAEFIKMRDIKRTEHAAYLKAKVNR